MGYSPWGLKELNTTELAMPRQGWKVDFLSLVLVAHLIPSI